jgi:hypothetical protein
LDKSVIGAGPDLIDIFWRRRQGVDDSPVFSFFGIVSLEDAEYSGDFIAFASQVWTDDFPAIAAVGGLEENVGTEIQHVGIDRREHDRHGADEAEFTGANRYGADFLNVARRPVEASDLAAIDKVGIQRIGRDVAVLFDAYGVPVAEADAAVITAALDSSGTAFLLRSIHPIGEAIVGNHVIELRGGLVVPGGPGGSGIDAEGCALVTGEQDDIGIARVDPDGVVIVSARSAFDGRKALAGIIGAIGGGVGDVNTVGIFRVHAYAGKIAAPAPDAFLVVDAGPGGAGIAGAERASEFFIGVNLRVEDARVTGRNSDTDAAQTLFYGGQALGELIPGLSAIGGLE